MRRDSAEQSDFDYWLRTGQSFGGNGRAVETAERKFNPWHDPDDGRFTFAGQGKFFPRRSNAERQTPIDRRSERGLTHRPEPRTTRSPLNANRAPKVVLGSLSEKYEAIGRDPGTVSIPRGDPGGVSYGSYQLSSSTGTLDAFLTAPEFGPWAGRFARLRAGTPEFNKEWRAIAEAQPAEFRDAQRVFIMRTHYEPVIARVQRDTGLNLNDASQAVREVAFSVSVQHSGRGATTILSRAVTRTDRTMNRSDPGYERALIINIYDRRIEYLRSLRDRALANHRRETARQFSNIINNRYPREREDALFILSQSERKRTR